MQRLTPEVVKQLWTCMCERYGTTVVRKQDSWIMRLAARVLPTSDFLEGYVTTIGRTIYVPFEIGDESPVGSHMWSLEGQAAVLGHELMHVVQERRDGWKYSWRYATSTHARAMYETEAYRATLEIKWVLGADRWDIESEANRHADGLKNYGCTSADVEQARALLLSYTNEIQKGGIVCETSRAIVEYLNG